MMRTDLFVTLGRLSQIDRSASRPLLPLQLKVPLHMDQSLTVDSIARRSLNIVLRTSIEKPPIFRPIMPETVPLRTALSVEGQNIVINGPRCLALDSMLKSRSPEAGDGHTV